MIEPATFQINIVDVPALRETISNIVRIGYSEAKVRERLGLQDLADLNWRELPMYREECLIARDPLDLAIDLLLLQQTLPANEFNGWLTESDRKILLESGLLAFDLTGMVGARASLFPVGDCLVFSDPAWPELSHPDYFRVPYDQVMYVGQDSRHLASCIARRRIHKTLDLCTGSGIQALLAAAHSDLVLAVDINPRAVRCAQFNAQASDVGNLQAVLGDLFEPVGEERFDLIIANPPFVSSPMNTLGFREGGKSGEEIQKRIVEGLPRHLAPGGMAQMITELGERKGESTVQRLREWLGDAPIDIHVLCLCYHTIHAYAIGHANGLSYDEFFNSVHLWLANLRAQGYQRIISMIVSFQWSDPVGSKPWERVEDSAPPVQYAGEEIEAAFLAERLSRRMDLNEKLMSSWVCLAGPLALLDARVLGSNISSAVKATPLGRALTMEYLLDPIQREILLRSRDRLSVSQLLTILGDLKIDEASVLAAITSLLKKRLLSIEGLSKIPK
jgi:hypothetical protein